jgi:hypothetical protein
MGILVVEYPTHFTWLIAKPIFSIRIAITAARADYNSSLPRIVVEGNVASYAAAFSISSLIVHTWSLNPLAIAGVVFFSASCLIRLTPHPVRGYRNRHEYASFWHW